MKVIISGGGTGGHIYPALAIAQGLQERVPDADILYVGTARGMESTIVPRAGFKFVTVDIKGINRASFLRASRDLARLPLSFFQGWNIIREFHPDIVIGTGGYASFPVVLASTFLGSCRTYIHEQNAMPGLANRRLAPRVNCVLLTFAEAEAYLKARSVKVTGLPVRKEIVEISKSPRKTSREFDNNRFTIFAFGGSRGARSINDAMIELVLRYQHDPLQLIWITGEKNYSEVKEALNSKVDTEGMNLRLHVLPYMYNIEEAFLAADLAVCRAGASTLSELCLLGLPAILVPYPYAADNHQEFNARALQNKKAAEMVIDEFLDGDTLYQKVEVLRRDSSLLKEMAGNLVKEAKPDALKEILDIVLQQ